jgi:hypothetical protein
MKVERFLAVYSNIGPENEEVDFIPLTITVDDIVKADINPQDDWDYLYYDPVELTEEQVKKVEPFLTRKIVFDFSDFFYVLFCTQA